MGTLYHLRNPFYALEELSHRADWAIVSTKIAQVTPKKLPIDEEPLAYLLDSREANNDTTNYWILSATALPGFLIGRAGLLSVMNVSDREPIQIRWIQMRISVCLFW